MIIILKLYGVFCKMPKLKFVKSQHFYQTIILLISCFACSEVIRDTLVTGSDTMVCRKYYNAKNMLLEEYCKKNGVNHGLAREWYDNGKLKNSCTYNTGKQIDTFYSYFESGKIESKCAPCGISYTIGVSGDTLYVGQGCAGISFGLRRIYFTKGNPQRFTNFSSTGQKDGWEVFWYSNGNVKDSILFRNDSTIARSSFYLNGRKQVIERDIYGPNGYSATSYTPKGKKNGAVINGTGAISVCDSIGANCHTLTFKNGKRVFE
jgi:antitoxin component YwqK of YwqJK toxin-antitoxin module